MKFLKMKKLIALFIAIITIAACSKDSGRRNRNPNIPSYSFNVELNLNLPLYSDLKYVNQAKMINLSGAGLNGIIVFNTDGNNFNAFEATCPNQIPTTCSKLTIDGIYAVCPCDNVKYSLFDGYGEAEYPMLSYRVEIIGDILKISN